MKLQLGDKIEASASIVKDHDDMKRRTYWPRTESPIKGMIVGKRTLSDGHTEDGFKYDGPDNYDYEPPVYVADRYFAAYLVAVNLYHKPVLVLEEDITEITRPTK